MMEELSAPEMPATLPPVPEMGLPPVPVAGIWMLSGRGSGGTRSIF